jgi:hypothetical protein
MIIKRPITNVLAGPAAIFNAEINTDNISMSNFGSVKFVIATGAGTAQTVSAQIVATMSDGSADEKVIRDSQITLGDNTTSSFLVSSSSLAHIEYDQVYLKIANAASADMLGCVFAVLGNERYSAEAEN